LREAPFSLAPDPRFLFASASHSTALAQVAYALQRREPLVIVTGEIGTGKTLLCRTVLQRLPGKTFLSVISDPLLERDDLLKQMLEDFGVISKDRTRLTATSRHELVQALHAFLSSLAPIQAHAVVIVDEAQHLQPDVLEQIRLLSNIDDAQGTALQIILVGQTGLEELLARPELRQLQQRVSRTLRLVALNRDEVEQYVEHRVRMAGGNTAAVAKDDTDFAWDLLESVGTNQRVEFTADALDAVSQLSGGIPRVINLLCDRGLEEAYGSRLRVIDRRLIHAAARTLGMDVPATPITPASLHLVARRTETDPLQPGEPLTTIEPEMPLENAWPADETAPVEFADAPSRLSAAPKALKYAGLALLIAAAGAAILFGVREARPGVAAPVRTSPPASPATGSSSTPSVPATPAGGSPAQRGAAGIGTPAPSDATAPAAAAGSGVSGRRSGGARPAGSPARLGCLAAGDRRPLLFPHSRRGRTAAPRIRRGSRHPTHADRAVNSRGLVRLGSLPAGLERLFHHSSLRERALTQVAVDRIHDDAPHRAVADFAQELQRGQGIRG
jgi:type II secretory pathway predicted ATPase ExeA